MPKLLLVEDDNNLREIYQARLQAEGYVIVTAKDGEEALVVAKAEKPDLIVADIMMPKISGFEMLDILRNTEGLKDIKIIMLTALGQSEDQDRANKLGADRYLVKSQVTLEDIVKAAHELLQASGAEEAPVEAPAATETPATEEAPAAEAKPLSIPVSEAPAEQAPAPAAETPTPVEAQSAASEEASVDANIESFVAGAGSETPTPETSAAAIEEKAANKASDDKLMSEAADSITDATKPEEEAPSSAPAPAGPPATEARPVETSASAAEAPSEATAAVGGVRVIEPTDSSEPKKDINDLLAIEEAKEAAKAQAPPPQQPQQAPAQPEAPAAEGPDPSSISL